MDQPRWLTWAKKLQEIAQNGIFYNQAPYRESPFDVERFDGVRQIASEMMAEHSGADAPHIRGLFAEGIGHATPKVDARSAVFQDSKILLVKERSDGCWTLPGGWADTNESPARGAERETLEESGYEVKATKLLALWDKMYHDHPPSPYHTYKAVFLCEIIGGQPTLNVEVDEIRFFGEDELPTLSMERITPRQLHRLFEHQRDPDLPTDFD